MSSSNELFVSLGTFAAGYLFSFGGEYLRSRSAKEDRSEERTNRELDRNAERDALEARLRAKRIARHLENQLSWLVELQDVLSNYMRAFGEIEHTDIMAVRQSGEVRIRVPLLPEELSERANVLQRKAIVLASRIDSKEVRDGVQALMGHYSRYEIRAEVNAAELLKRGSIVAESFTSNIQAIGTDLRRLAEKHGA